MKDKDGKKYYLSTFWFQPVGLDVFENDGTSENGCIEIEDRELSVHFGLGFQENSIYT